MELVSNYLTRARYHRVIPYLRGDILEIGCGMSPVIATLSASQNYCGIDVESSFVTLLRQLFPTREFHQLNVEQDTLALGEKQFDTLLLVAVLEHLACPAKVLSALTAYLKNGGQVVLTTPTPVGHRMHRLGARCGIFSRVAAEDHRSILDKEDLQHICESIGLKLRVYRSFQFGGNQLVVAEKCV